MKKTIKALKYLTVLLFVFLSFIACDKDFSVVESDVLGEQNLNFKTDTLVFQIAAYNKKLEALQINGLSSNLLGVYNDPAYGQTIASIITQITPTTLSPNFNDTPAIDSVVLSIPYFSRVTGTDTDAFAYSNGGVASALISLPLRYMHTTVEMVHREDVENVIKLIYESLLNIKDGETFSYFK